MSQQQLDRVYDQIKAGETEQAREILEPMIRADRDNSDAWWLYANATEDPEAKRNALNNLLRIGVSREREAQVKEMLHALNPNYATPIRQAQPAPSTPKRRRTTMIVVGILTFMACGIGYWLFSAIGTMMIAPQSYDYIGEITLDEAMRGYVDTEGDWDGYLYEGTAGENLIFRTVALGEHEPPFVFLYDPDDRLIGFPNRIEPEVNGIDKITLPRDGTYLVLIRTFVGSGQGEYSLYVSK